MRPDDEVKQTIEQYAGTIRRTCFPHLKSHADIEDIFQTLFSKYSLYTGGFQDARYEKEKRDAIKTGISFLSLYLFCCAIIFLLGSKTRRGVQGADFRGFRAC